MGRRRQPIDLIVAKGKKHVTAQYVEERRAQELKVPFTDVRPPAILTKKRQKEEFNDIGKKLVALNIFTELDVDALARYILAKELYEAYTKRLAKLLRDSDANIGDLKDLQGLQDKAYRQCAASAGELCLNISSRAKLVVPPPPDGEDDEL